MTYQFEINIRPCVNHHTKSAEVYVTDHTYDGAGSGIVVRQKHIASVDDPELTAESFCANLHKKVCEFIRKELESLSNAKP